MSHYGSYIAEREGKNILEDENGFLTWFFHGECCYLADIYVIPEKRLSGVGKTYVDKVAEYARAKGYKSLMGTVTPSLKGSTESMKAHLAYGFKLHSAHQDKIFLEYKLEE